MSGPFGAIPSERPLTGEVDRRSDPVYMNANWKGVRLFFAPEHGGVNVKGGRPQADPEDDGSEQIMDALGQTVTGHGKTPGTGDPGVPGSRTNPVHSGTKPQADAEIGEGFRAGS